MIYIYAVHKAGGSRHEHIESVRWKNPDGGESDQSTVAQIIKWIEEGGAAYVCGGHAHMARVGVVNATPPYLRTHADGDWSDNLLSLPTY